MLEAMKNHNFIDTILSWLKRMVELFKKHPLQAELVKLQNDIEKLYKQASKQGFADGEVRYSLGEYSQHQKDNWANSKSIVVYENEQQLRQFIEDAINKRNLNKKMYFGTVSKRLADSIMRVKDIDLYNYNCTLSASEIRKILEDHGNENIESLRGQRAVVVDDFSKIPYIIENADYIYDAGVGDNNRPAVRFVNEDSKISIVAYVTDKHLDLTVQTMYAGIKKKAILPLEQMNEPLPIRPKRTAVQLPLTTIYHKKLMLSIVVYPKIRKVIPPVIPLMLTIHILITTL